MTAPKLAYSAQEAADATGLSVDVIRRAVRAGDLATVSPTVGGKKLGKWVVTADELQRWIGAA